MPWGSWLEWTYGIAKRGSRSRGAFGAAFRDRNVVLNSEERPAVIGGAGKDAKNRRKMAVWVPGTE